MMRKYIYNGVIPSMAAFLQHITGLKSRNKIGAASGSHGWGGEYVCQICDMFDKLKFNRIPIELCCISFSYPFATGKRMNTVQKIINKNIYLERWWREDNSYCN